MSDALVFQSDFGLVDGAVAAMYGVALDVDKDLKIFNLTHDITPYNIWEASYRLISPLNIGRRERFLFPLLTRALVLPEKALLRKLPRDSLL